MNNYNEVKNNARKNGILLDFCGSDDRYYHNGLYTDLCGMSVEDFIKSTQINCNNTGGSDTPEVIVKNMNTIIFTNNDEYKLFVYPNKAPKTDINISFVCENNSFNVILKKDTTQSIDVNYIISDKNWTISNVVITPNEDDVYKYGDYKVNKKEIMEKHIVYYDMVNTLTYNELIESEIVNFDSLTATTDEQTINYTIPGAGENVDDLPDDEYNEWENNNSYYKALVVPNSIYTDQNNKRFNLLLGTVDAFVGFEKVKNIIINNKEYSLLIDVDDKSNNSSMEEIIAGTYKFSLTE